MASESLAARLVKASGNKTAANDCIQQNGLRKGYGQFLVAKSLPFSKGKGSYRLVRPTQAPWCTAFYGAHTFSLWVVDQKQHVIFAGAADTFEVLDTSSNGMLDLLVSQCRGGYCYRSTWTFALGSYTVHSCDTQEIESGSITKECKS